MPDAVLLSAISGGSAILGAVAGAGGSVVTAAKSQRIQADEDHFRHRQSVYHEFLDSAHDFMHSAGVPSADKEAAGWNAWFLDFQTKQNAVQLFGTKEVRKKATALRDEIEGVLTEYEKVGVATRQDAYRALEQDVLVAYAACITAMRQDIGVEE